jgi:hypothetical protein
MTLVITHAKTNTIPDWTQPQLDVVVAGGSAPLLPSGTILNDIVLPSDWNAPLNISGTLPSANLEAAGSNTQIQFNNAGAFGGFGAWTGSALEIPGSTTSTYTTDAVLRNAFATPPTGATRNDADLVVGFTFIPVVSMSVTQLGRLYVAGNVQNHQAGIWEKATGVLIASGTILAASSSDANNYKYVTIGSVTLDPTKEYIIACQEFAGGDTWTDLWTSTDSFNTYVSRTGFGYKNGSTLGVPNVFQTGQFIYNSCTFKFTPNVIGQMSSAYDSTNFLSLISNSNGTGSIVTNNNDKTLAIFNQLGIGIGSVSAGFKAEISGGLKATGTIPIRTVGASGGLADTLTIGCNSLSNQNSISVRGGYILLESGAGADVLLNYDHPTRNVSISGIGAGKFNVFINSPSKVGQITRGAASQTANLTEWQDSAGTILASISSDGTISTVDRYYGATGGGGLFSVAGDSTGMYLTANNQSFGVRILSGTSGYVMQAAGSFYGWTSNTSSVYAQTLDTALSRNAAGVVEINNGTAGTFRDLIMRDITLNPSSSRTPTVNGQLMIEATSNTSLTFKYKGSDGTVRSASLTLA